MYIFTPYLTKKGIKVTGEGIHYDSELFSNVVNLELIRSKYLIC